MTMGADLLAIIKEEQKLAEEAARKPLVDCPICGNVLQVNSRGEKNCDVGHFRTGA